MLVAEVAHGQFVCPAPNRRSCERNRHAHGLTRLHGARLLAREQQTVRRGFASHHDNKPVSEELEGSRGRHNESVRIAEAQSYEDAGIDNTLCHAVILYQGSQWH